jgi:hypothetical protein
MLTSFGQNLKGTDDICIDGRTEEDGFNWPREGLGM